MIKLQDWAIDKAIEKFLRYKEKGKSGMLGEKSPYPELDEQTSWIIQGKVYTIAWYSNVGKSKFAYSYVNHFLGAGKVVLFFSLEVDAGMVLRNLVANRYSVNFRDAGGETPKQEDFGNLFIFDQVFDLETMDEIIEEAKPDIVFIDFVQNIHAGGGSSYEQMSNIAKNIQRIAIENNTTIFSLSQVSNESGRNLSTGMNRWPVALKGAGELYASSDVIFVLRPSDEPNKIHIKIEKNKFWPKPEEMLYSVNFSKWEFVIDPQSNPKASPGF